MLLFSDVDLVGSGGVMTRQDCGVTTLAGQYREDILTIV